MEQSRSDAESVLALLLSFNPYDTTAAQPLAACGDWALFLDPETLFPYYLCLPTSHSSWEAPAEWSDAEAFVPPLAILAFAGDELWRVYRDNATLTQYFVRCNVETGEPDPSVAPTWAPPKGLVDSGHLREGEGALIAWDAAADAADDSARESYEADTNRVKRAMSLDEQAAVLSRNEGSVDAPAILLARVRGWEVYESIMPPTIGYYYYFHRDCNECTWLVPVDVKQASDEEWDIVGYDKTAYGEALTGLQDETRDTAPLMITTPGRASAAIANESTSFVLDKRSWRERVAERKAAKAEEATAAPPSENRSPSALVTTSSTDESRPRRQSVAPADFPISASPASATTNKQSTSTATGAVDSTIAPLEGLVLHIRPIGLGPLAPPPSSVQSVSAVASTSGPSSEASPELIRKLSIRLPRPALASRLGDEASKRVAATLSLRRPSTTLLGYRRRGSDAENVIAAITGVEQSMAGDSGYIQQAPQQEVAAPDASNSAAIDLLEGYDRLKSLRPTSSHAVMSGPGAVTGHGDGAKSSEPAPSAPPHALTSPGSFLLSAIFSGSGEAQPTSSKSAFLQQSTYSQPTAEPTSLAVAAAAAAPAWLHAHPAAPPPPLPASDDSHPGFVSTWGSGFGLGLGNRFGAASVVVTKQYVAPPPPPPPPPAPAMIVASEEAALPDTVAPLAPSQLGAEAVKGTIDRLKSQRTLISHAQEEAEAEAPAVAEVAWVDQHLYNHNDADDRASLGALAAAVGIEVGALQSSLSKWWAARQRARP